MDEAASMLGMGGPDRARQLRRLLQARERQLGVPFLLRKSERPKSPYMVTEPLLREHCPELFSRREEMAEALRARIEELEAQISELFKRDDAIATRVGQLSRSRRNQG